MYSNEWVGEEDFYTMGRGTRNHGWLSGRGSRISKKKKEKKRVSITLCKEGEYNLGWAGMGLCVLEMFAIFWVSV